MDSLTLKGLQFFAHHGTEAWEKDTGRRFEVDVELFADLGRPGRSDAVADVIDYRRVYARARKVVVDEQHDLIERVAWRLLEEMMRAFPVDAVRVRVAKPEAPLGGLNQSATVTIHRTREAFEREANSPTALD